MSTRVDAVRRLALARRRIARAIVDDPAPAVLGAVTLRSHQRDAVARLRRVLRDSGGALLADDAGLGKTYVALALARETRRALVVLPAALRATWTQAMRAADVHVPVLTHESLSRRSPAIGDPPDFVIVDEAHHARNPATRRWRALAELTRHARVLLLSATPVHNRRADLVALLSLFLGASAWSMSDTALARCIVRRQRGDAVVADEPLPEVLPARLLALSHDDELLDRLIELPPPFGRAVPGDGSALVVLGFIRQWASSEGALRQALVRQLARAAGLEAALREGRRPDAAELARWRTADEVVQLPFAALLAPPEPDADALLRDVQAHAASIRGVVRCIDAGIGRDAERAARLLQLRRRHQGARIVAFTCYAGTVRALWRHLRVEPGVAALTSAGGVVAGGALARDEALRRFAPRAHGHVPMGRGEDVTLLVTTDLASEGVNLQDASVVVHLDLPWTPARLEQRVGRAARPGATHDVVHVYAMAPPASADAVLGIERRLREKLAAAARSVGVSGAILPPIAFRERGPTESGESAPRLMERTRARIAAWSDTVNDRDAQVLVVAAVRAADRLDVGALALADDGDGARLVAVEDQHVSTAPAAIARAVRIVDEGVPCDVQPVAARAVLRRLRAWLRARQGARSAGVDDIGAAVLRRRVAAEAAGALSRAPRHARTQAARDAQRLREAAIAARGAGAELALERWLASPVRSPPHTALEAGRMERVGPGGVTVLVLLLPDASHGDRAEASGQARACGREPASARVPPS